MKISKQTLKHHHMYAYKYIYTCIHMYVTYTFLKLIYFNWGLITLHYCSGFAIHWHESAMGVHVSPSWTSLLLPSPSHPSGSSQCTSPEHPVSCIGPGLATCFTYGNIHVSMLFSQSSHPCLLPESKWLFCIAVSLFLSHIQGNRYHLPKFHIHALVYGIVFLSGLLHSV